MVKHESPCFKAVAAVCWPTRREGGREREGGELEKLRERKGEQRMRARAWARARGKEREGEREERWKTRGDREGSGPRYQILSHVFAHCASQKTRAILACPCVF